MSALHCTDWLHLYPHGTGFLHNLVERLIKPAKGAGLRSLACALACTALG